MLRPLCITTLMTVETEQIDWSDLEAGSGDWRREEGLGESRPDLGSGHSAELTGI